MLYNPQWQTPSVAGFKAWLERQNPDETFIYCSWEYCAGGQYIRSLGMAWQDLDKSNPVLLDELNDFARRAVLKSTSGTFGQPSFGEVLREMDQVI